MITSSLLSPPSRRTGRGGNVGSALCFTILFFIAGANAVTADTLIDNFERTNAPAPWTFSNGPEFPGATGSLTVGAGHSGQGAHLAYDLSQGGNYVGANLPLAFPLTAAAIGFWVKSPPNITIVLRVQDASGQTLQYNLRRPLENPDPNSWYQHAVGLDSASGWWGGANDGALHNPISSLSILAADPPEPGAIGAIDIDDVTALSSNVFNLDPIQQPLVPTPCSSNDFLSQLGVNIHFTSDDTALDEARIASFAWVRMDLVWAAIETQTNVYNWTAYDNLINSLNSRGMKALLILDYGNPLYTGAYNLPPTNAVAIQAFGNFAEAAARHFAGQNVRFEVWNEPNISVFWPPTPNSSQYAALSQNAIRRLHQGDPAASVTTGGLAGFDFNFINGCLNSGGGTNADAIGVHPYDCNPPEMLADRLLLLRTIISRYFTNAPPVWDTEWGFSSARFGDGHSANARQTQALMVARELLCACAEGFSQIIYYDLRDDGSSSTDAEHNFGLLASDYSEKPAMQAVKTLSAIAQGRRFSGFIHTTLSGLNAMRFDGLTNLTVALWNSAAAGVAAITFPTNATAVDFLGTPLALQNQTNSLTWVLSPTNGPIYVSFPGTWQVTNLAPLLTGGWRQGSGFCLDLNIPTGLACAIFASTDLINWSTLTNFYGTGSSRYLDGQGVTLPARFYRARVEP